MKRAAAAGRPVRGDISNDAHLATLALEHGARIVTFDRNFLRFKRLRLALLTA